MRALVTAAALCAIFTWSPASSVEAAIVDAGAVTAVAVEALLYDSRLGAAGGCDPAGCAGELTRVGGCVWSTFFCVYMKVHAVRYVSLRVVRCRVGRRICTR